MTCMYILSILYQCNNTCMWSIVVFVFNCFELLVLIFRKASVMSILDPLEEYHGSHTLLFPPS